MIFNETYFAKTLPIEKQIPDSSSCHFFAKHLGYVSDIEKILAEIE